MQPQEPTINRRPLDVEDYIDILRRHKGWILGPLFAALVISVVVAFVWPDTYVSVATIRVVPPQVPENFVPANVNMDVQGRVNSLIQLILNRATLTNIINTHNLYKKDRERLPLDDVIENMRLYDIKCCPVLQTAQRSERTQYPAFQIGFAYNNRFIAQKVTTDLVSRFLEENVREVSQQTVSTTQFLHDQWDSAKKKLDDIEQKLSVFRTRNMGRLPEEQQTNYQGLNAMQAQMLTLNTSMNRVNQEKLLYENQLRIFREQLSSLKDPNGQDQAQQQKNEKLAEKDREIEQYENSLAAARERYKESHPDVQRLATMLAAAKKQREAIVKQEETKKPEAPVARPANPQLVKEQRDLDVAIQRIQGLIQAKDLERNDYEDLDRRVTASAMSTALENRQQGERLEQLDPPSTPPTPTQPKRPLIIAIGTGIGLIAGICLAGAWEVKDTALKNLKDVRAYAQLPVLGSIPLLENNLVVRRRKRLGWLAWSTACLVGVMIMSGSVVYYYASKL